MRAALGEVLVLPSAPSGVSERGARRRRSWTVEQKLAIVKEAAESGDPVAVVARRHDMSANHLFMWMQQAQDGALGGRRSDPRRPGGMDFIDLGRVGGRMTAPAGSGAIEIELSGGTRVRVTPPVDVEALGQVLGVVKAVL